MGFLETLQGRDPGTSERAGSTRGGSAGAGSGRRGGAARAGGPDTGSGEGDVPSGAHRVRHAAPLVPLLGTLIVAVGAHLVLERVRIGAEAGTLWQWVSGDGSAEFLLGTVVVWLLVVLGYAVLGGFWTTATVVLAAAALVSHAHEQKLELRLEPLHPSDLPVAVNVEFLTQMAGVTSVLTLLGATIAGVVLAALADRRLRGSLTGQERRPSTRQRLLRRGGTALLAGAALVHVGDFHGPENLLRSAYEEGGTQWVPFDQPANYARNGFVAGTLFNLDATAMERPAEYSKAELDRITERYTALADEVNAFRDPTALDDTNVVIVLSESLSDPVRMPGVRFAEDPLPFTRALMGRSTSGTVLTPAYGGGTANVEFEVLTGMTTAELTPQLSTPFPMLVAESEHFPSHVPSFSQLGHGTLTVHPYSPVLYRRPDVYRALGLEESVFIDDVRHDQRLERSPFVSDRAAFEEVLDRLEESPQPLLVNLVTMQNHGPYDDRTDTPIIVSGDVTKDEAAELGEYARGLRQSDEALEWLTKELEGSPERTVVLVYGDHLPGIWPASLRERAGARTTHETPFLVHTNFEPAEVRDRGTVGPVHLVNAVLDTLQAPLTPYQALLSRVEEHVPARSRSLTLGPGGEELTQGELTPEAREVLAEYRLVQYDLAVGERWSAERMLSHTPRRR